MGLFSFIGKGLGALGKGIAGAAGGFLGGGPLGALSGGLGGLLGGGGIGDVLKGAGLGGLGGLLAPQGTNPALIAAISGLGSAQLAESAKQRQANEAMINYRTNLLNRNLGMAEQSFADLAPLRQMGMGAVQNFMQGGGGPHRGIFQTPGEPVGTGGLSGLQMPGNTLFGGGQLGATPAPTAEPPTGAGTFKATDVLKQGPLSGLFSGAGGGGGSSPSRSEKAAGRNLFGQRLAEKYGGDSLRT